MDKRLMKLKTMGCDIDGAMDRFLNDEEFYFECYDKVMRDPCFGELKDALEQHHIKQAFDNAHTLKGVIGNLGLNPLFEKMTQIVEPLRAGTDEGVLEKYNELMELREKYIDL